MKRYGRLYGVIILSLLIMQVNCSAPQYFWPQKNSQVTEVNTLALEKKLLIAARSSEFKDAVVLRIKEAFMREDTYIKLIGIDQLKEENSSDYSAVVVINTCMGWNMDRHVKGFLKRNKNQSNVIILTTSGDGNWLPKMEEYSFDAVSSASEKQKVDEIADKIIGKVRLLAQIGT